MAAPDCVKWPRDGAEYVENAAEGSAALLQKEDGFEIDGGRVGQGFDHHLR